MKIETQIDEAQARIEALRLELALVEGHKSRLQLAQNLVAEITNTISDKLEELAALVSPDCLVQAVDTINFEVEKAATLLLTPDYDDSRERETELQERAYCGSDVLSEEYSYSSDRPLLEPLDDYEYDYDYEDDYETGNNGEPPEYIEKEVEKDEENISHEIPLSSAEQAESTEIKQYQAQYFEEVELDGKVFKINDRVKIDEASAKYAGITGTIIKLEKTFATIIPDNPYFLKVGKREIPCPDFYWYLSEMELLPVEAEAEPEPEQVNNLDSQQTNNAYAPLEQFGEYVSYRNVPGQSGAIAYLASNNKGRLEGWLNWLIVRHNFADCGEVCTPKSDKESRTFKGKHHLKLWHLDAEALTWICQNYDHKSGHPQQDVPNRKRPDPAAPKQQSVPASFLTYKKDFDAGLELLQGRGETEEELEKLAEIGKEMIDELENYATNMQALHSFGGLTVVVENKKAADAIPF